MSFKKAFESVTGFSPMKWQCRLYDEYFVKSQIPASLDIPTGLGKTSVMTIWYLARKAGAKLPRRVVYVVDRRAVVDQATTVANRIKEHSGDTDLRISTLRGQYVDNREWLEGPDKLAIVVGTVDMVGSRLLFSGYGVSRKTRSYHAGLLGADTLVVLDESHLVPPFERLLEAIETGKETFGAQSREKRAIVPSFQLLSLSATGHERQGERFRLDENKGDLDDEIVKRRLKARKSLSTEPRGDAKLEEVLADSAWRLSDAGSSPGRILVYCNSRDVADTVKQNIQKKAKSERLDIETELLVGARRVRERTNASEWLERHGFLANSDTQSSVAAFLIATSAGEVGVDMDADHMVCDLVEWERMVQRFGRVNRKGEGDARIVLVLDPPAPSKKEGEIANKEQSGERLDEKEQKASEQYAARCRVMVEHKAPLDELPQTEGGTDVSPSALLHLKSRAESDETLAQIIRTASTAPPLRPELTRALVDAWSMTSVKKHTGRPEVAPWLRGWADEDDPQTAVVWRKFLPLRLEGPEPSREEIEGFFEAAPPHLSERLETETWRVQTWLEKRIAVLIKKHPDWERNNRVVAFVLDPDGSLRAPLYIQNLIEGSDKKRERERTENLRRTLAGSVLIAGRDLGGLKVGLLDSDVEDEVRTADDGDEWPTDVGFRIISAAVDEVLEQQARIAGSFALRQSNEGESVEQLLIVTTRTEDSRAVSPHPQLLDEHETWAADCAGRIADTVGLTGNHKRALVIAARSHDEGKRALRWQLAFNAPRGGQPYAKTKGPLIPARLGGYRHELGSLPYVEKDAEFRRLPKDLQDLVLHLVAAHHGRARPVIGTEGCEDAPPSVLEVRARDVALRFARLQKQWGPWGLAWWEVVLRAADQQASRENDQRGKADG